VFCVGWHLAVSHKYDSNSLAVLLHVNKTNAAGNSKRLYIPALIGLHAWCQQLILTIQKGRNQLVAKNDQPLHTLQHQAETKIF